MWFICVGSSWQGVSLGSVCRATGTGIKRGQENSQCKWGKPRAVHSNIIRAAMKEDTKQCERSHIMCKPWLGLWNDASTRGWICFQSASCVSGRTRVSECQWFECACELCLSECVRVLVCVSEIHYLSWNGNRMMRGNMWLMMWLGLSVRKECSCWMELGRGSILISGKLWVNKTIWRGRVDLKKTLS